MPKLEVVNANNIIEYSPQKANFKLKNTGGPKGEPGAQGPKGDTGPQGPAGPQGIQGEKGDKGAQGERGPQGIQGPQGPQGIQGPKGDKGDKGNTGATGPQGPQGPAGQNGTDGADGVDGFSPIATVTQEGLDAEISITDKNGTTTATVPGFGVQVVESLPATGTENVIYLKRTESTASGKSISVSDAVEAPLTDFQLKGETSQQTYTGKNLLKMPIVSGSSNGITWTVQGDGSIILNGASTAGVSIRANNVTIPAVEGETYTLSATGMGEAYNFGYKNSSSGDNIFVVTSTSPTTTAVVTSTMLSQANRLDMYIQSGKTFNNQRVTLQLEKGSSATSFEPYVGGTASPNPDYPQAVQTVTGENVVKITGKNLFDKNAITSGKYISNTGTLVDAASFAYSDYIPVIGGENYSYSGSTQTTASDPPKGAWYDKDKNWVSKQDYTQSGTITAPENAAYYRTSIRITASSTAQPYADTYQLELGSTATAYEPYQGQSYEVNLGKNLAKITSGTYQYAAAGQTFTLANGSITTTRTNGAAQGGCINITTGGTGQWGSGDGINNRLTENGGTYSVSIWADGTRTGGTDVNSFVAVYVYKVNSAGTRSTAATLILENNASTATVSFSLAPNEYVCLVGFYSQYVTYEDLKVNIQLEKGSQATSYAAYFEPIELCKIGTYQDYIYKDGTGWKIHKVVSHDVFNWDVNGIASNNTSGTTVVSAEGAFSVFFLSGSISNSDRPNMRLSENIGTYNSSQQIYANGEARAMTDGTFKPRDMSGTVDRFYFRNTAYIGKTGNEVKNILVEKTGGIGLWWFLTTPTDTEITNETLVAQLEAILSQGYTYAGTDNITTIIAAGNEQGELEVGYYNAYDSYLYVAGRWQQFARLTAANE